MEAAEKKSELNEKILLSGDDFPENENSCLNDLSVPQSQEEKHETSEEKTSSIFLTSVHDDFPDNDEDAIVIKPEIVDLENAKSETAPSLDDELAQIMVERIAEREAIFSQTEESVDPKLQEFKSLHFLGIINKGTCMQFLFKHSPIFLHIDTPFNPLNDVSYWTDPEEDKIRTFVILSGYKVNKIEWRHVDGTCPLLEKYKVTKSEGYTHQQLAQIDITFKLGSDVQTRSVIRSVCTPEECDPLPVEYY